MDTSVVVAAFATWHALHEVARRCLDRGARLPAQASLEAYSVLTRIPPPFRALPGDFVEFLDSWFERPYLSLDSRRFSTFVHGLPARGIVGGATYDALIAAVAAAHGGRLATCDLRAASTYERFDVAVEYLG